MQRARKTRIVTFLVVTASWSGISLANDAELQNRVEYVLAEENLVGKAVGIWLKPDGPSAALPARAAPRG